MPEDIVLGLGPKKDRNNRRKSLKHADVNCRDQNGNKQLIRADQGIKTNKFNNGVSFSNKGGVATI